MVKRKEQLGVSMIGLMLWGILIVFVALATMKLVPAYTDFFTVQKILKDIGGDPAIKNMSNAEIRDKFERRAMVDNITTVKSTDLVINRESGQPVVSADYSFKTQLIGNLSFWVDFSASSSGRESKMAQQLE